MKEHIDGMVNCEILKAKKREFDYASPLVLVKTKGNIRLSCDYKANGVNKAILKESYGVPKIK